MKVLVVFIAVLGAMTCRADDVKIEAHYKQAGELRSQGKFAEAAEEVAKGIAFNTENKDLYAKCEFLSAELYVELNMLEAAEVTARQVELLYAGTEFEAKAKTLRGKIKHLLDEQLTEEAEQAAESE